LQNYDIITKYDPSNYQLADSLTRLQTTKKHEMSSMSSNFNGAYM